MEQGTYKGSGWTVGTAERLSATHCKNLFCTESRQQWIKQCSPTFWKDHKLSGKWVWKYCGKQCGTGMAERNHRAAGKEHGALALSQGSGWASYPGVEMRFSRWQREDTPCSRPGVSHSKEQLRKMHRSLTGADSDKHFKDQEEEQQPLILCKRALYKSKNGYWFNSQCSSPWVVLSDSFILLAAEPSHVP